LALRFEDAPFIGAFIDYYLALGFDRIIVLDSRGLSIQSTEKVRVHRVPNLGNDLYAKYFDLVRESRAEWVFTCDSDEFLLINAPSIGSFIDRIELEHGRTDLFYFRWAVIDHTAPWCAGDEPLKRLIHRECATPHFLHKHMSRVAVVKMVRPHCVEARDLSRELRVYQDGHPLSLPPKQICGRINRIELARRPSYADSALVHVHTRSLSDLLTKATRTGLPLKGLRNADALVQLMGTAPSMDTTSRLATFVKVVGVKAQLPLNNIQRLPAIFGDRCGLTSNFVRRRMAQLLPFIPLGNRSMCDKHVERLGVREMLSDLSNATISMAEYGKFAAAIGEAYASRRVGAQPSHVYVLAE
jgi:hypothetical protein